LEIKNFKASSKWISKFKKSYGIKTQMISGEEGLVNPLILCESWVDFEKVYKNYDKCDVFNCDETGLFFKCPPKKTLISRSEEKASGKFSKE